MRFLDELDATIARYALLDHPFYQAWNAGSLTPAVLAEYAKQYYAHVQAFPTYVSAVHSHCGDLGTRQLLLENLIEEEQGPHNHPELWLRFAEGLGVSRENVQHTDLLPETKVSVGTMKRLSGSEDYREGLAALYAYESQIPEVARTKRDGLRSFYGIEDARTVAFFRVHEEADLIHRQVERDILAAQTLDYDSKSKVLEAADKAAHALWTFLDGVHEVFVVGSTAGAAG
jgi:pyrroloquinoline-quinone synthase